MTRTNKLTAGTLAMLLTASALSGGCAIQNPLGLFGPNFGINLIIPLGLNGNPGILNPFGIVQAIVNGVLGSIAPTGGTTTTGGGGTGSPSGIPGIL